MLTPLRDFFGCTKIEAQGFLMLLFLAVLPMLSLAWLQPSAPPRLAHASDALLLDSLVAALQPAFPADTSRREWKKGGKFEKPPKKVDLGTADTADLEALRGIGQTLAARIVKFRDRLGGFHSLDQLKEVYGLSEEARAMLLEQSYLGKHEVKKIPINLWPSDSLGRHPYIGYKAAKQLCQYRKQHGPFRQSGDLYGMHGTDSAWVHRLEPYLSFE